MVLATRGFTTFSSAFTRLLVLLMATSRVKNALCRLASVTSSSTVLPYASLHLAICCPPEERPVRSILDSPGSFTQSYFGILIPATLSVCVSTVTCTLTTMCCTHWLAGCVVPTWGFQPCSLLQKEGNRDLMQFTMYMGRYLRCFYVIEDCVLDALPRCILCFRHGEERGLHGITHLLFSLQYLFQYLRIPTPCSISFGQHECCVRIWKAATAPTML